MPKSLSVEIEALVDRIQEFDASAFPDAMAAASELLHVEHRLNALIARALPGSTQLSDAQESRDVALLDQDYATEEAVPLGSSRRRARG